MLAESENVMICPLAVKFTYDFFKEGKKTVMLNFMNKRSDNYHVKLFISNLTKNIGMTINF